MGGVIGNYANLTVGDGSNDNSLTVSGLGSTYEISASLTVGGSGSYNRTEVKDGATMDLGSSVTVGSYTGSNNNFVQISDSLLNAHKSINVGYLGNGNSFVIENGSTVTSGLSFRSTIGVGSSTNASLGNGNSMSVIGVGSSWTNQSAGITVGEYGSGNSLTIEEGGVVNSQGNSIIGHYLSDDVSSDYNMVAVSGTGSRWNVTGEITIGESGSNNFLMIADGALVKATDLKISANDQVDNDGNYLRLAEGFLALNGDKVDEFEEFIAGSLIRVWDEDCYDWVAGTLGDFQISFFDIDQGAEAEAFSGYAGLEGYTIITTIPEPSTWMLLGVTALVAVPLVRRSRWI